MRLLAKKIVILGPLPPPYGGVAVFNALLEWNLRAKGYHVTSIHVGTKENYIAALQAISRNSVIIDSYSGVLEYPELRVFRWYLKGKKINWIKVLHDATLPSRFCNFSILQKTFSQTNAALFDSIVCVSKALHEWVLNHCYLSRSTVIPSLLPLPLGYVSMDSADHFSLPQPYVVTVGTPAPVYGVQGVIDVIKKIRSTGVDLNLVILDGGFSSDNVKCDAVDEGIIRLTCVPHQDALRIIKGANALIRNVQHESVGLCRIEALLQGTPVIATNTGEVRFVKTYDFGDEKRLQELVIECLYSSEATSVEIKDFYSALADENLGSYLSLISEMQ
ncbi:glycosyltransferase [Oleidesulfovibrio sp.]|uniref:glycosyltransferase n=1 Tax=Oleidesulfovibrio sp. TaxID=2909707 RepID=UPI003A837C05